MGSSLPASKADALLVGSKHYFTGRPCKSGHVEKRWAHNAVCDGCLQVSRRLWLAAHPEKPRAYTAKYRQGHPEVGPAYERRRWEAEKAAGSPKNKQYYANNTAKERARRVKGRLANLEYERAKSREDSRRFRAENPGKVATWDAQKHRRRGLAVPSWLTADHAAQIDAIYREARARGAEWHVDHIVPLCGKNFCGLHVPWNLQVIPRAENLSKRNAMPPPSEWLAWPARWIPMNSLQEKYGGC